MSSQTRKIVVEILNNIEEKGSYSNIEINRVLKEGNLIQADKSLLTELVYGVLENRYAIDWIISSFSTVKIKKISLPILNIIRIGVYQLVYLDKIPDYSAVNESVNLAKKFGHPASVKFVNGILRTISRKKDNITFPTREENFIKYVEIKYSHPQWLIETLISQYGSEITEEICKANNDKKPLSLRVNTLKTTTDQLLKSLNQKEGWIVRKGDLQDCLIVEKSIGLFSSNEFEGGLFLIQDQSSMLVSKVLDPKPNQLVVDCCSAPGGKTTHLAQLMNNKGEILARDIYEHKINLVEQNSKKLSIDIIKTQIFDASKIDKDMISRADCVLVDAPCSGLGIIGRKPEIKWNKKPEDITAISRLQLKILEANSKMVKKGGTIVYSTCTIVDQENIGVVSEFLKNNPEFKLVDISSYVPPTLDIQSAKDGYMQILQTTKDFDGFFISKMRRLD